MINPKVKDLFLQAESDLGRSQDELNRPAFDVVKYAVCVTGRTAIHRYTKCLYLFYTEKNGDKQLENPTIEQMVDYCKQHNANLAEMNFFPLHCMNRDVLNTEEVFYCNDLNQVKTCSEIAGEVRDIFIDDILGGQLELVQS